MNFLKLNFIKIIIFYFLFSCINGSITNNWVILVDTSRFWFNYRHIGNVLGFYHSVKRLGIPDSRIILMIADDAVCNARNPYPAEVFNTAFNPIDLYGDDVEVDYRGSEVTVENFIRVLTNRHHHSVPNSKRLLSDQFSNIMIYITGHGGNGFIKFQDDNEISSKELADAFEQMWQKKRYNEILFIADTCQAESLTLPIYSPNIIGVGSSKVGQDSLSHHLDENIGVFVADRYSYYSLEFLDRIQPNSKVTLDKFLNCCPYYKCESDVTIRTDLYKRNVNQVLVTEFFSNIRQIEFLDDQLTIINPAIYNNTQIISDDASTHNLTPIEDYKYFDASELYYL